MGKCATGKAKLIRGFAFGGDPNATTGRTDRIDANGNNLALTDAMKANPTAFGAREPGAAGVNPYELGAGTTTGLSGAAHYSASDASTVAVPPVAGATQKTQIPSALAKIDQDIALGNALGGLSNTERYQMANPDNQPYSVGASQGRAGRGMSGMVSGATPGSAAEASQNMQRISIMSSLRDKLAAQPGFANGGKIQGPGTPTSDSLQAKVEETGEPIAVSTGERIVSKAQDVLLQKIAQGMGYDSLDALLEEGTGKPVGPTMKGGMAHAAEGGVVRDFSVPIEEQIKGAQAVAEKRPYVAPAQAAPVSRNEILTDASARAADPELAAAAGPMVRPLTSGVGAGRGQVNPTFNDPSRMAQPDMNAGILNQAQYNSPETQQAGDKTARANQTISDAQKLINFPSLTRLPLAGPSVNAREGDAFTARGNAGLKAIANNDSIRGAMNSAHELQGDGIRYDSVTGTDGRKQVSISDRGGVSKEQYLATDGTTTNDWTKTKRYADAIAQNGKDKEVLAGMQRERLMRDMGADITSPGTRLAAQQQLAQMDKADGMAMLASKSQREDATAGLDQQLKGQQIAQLTQNEDLRKRVIDGDPKAIEQWNFFNRKPDDSENKPFTHVLDAGKDEMGNPRPQYLVTGKGTNIKTAMTGEEIRKSQVSAAKPDYSAYEKKYLEKRPGTDLKKIKADYAELHGAK